jgi:hypothetical protein
MKPEIILGDFSHAIRNAAQKELPTATYYADIFHLFHDNRKWLRRSGISKAECSIIINQLRHVVTRRSYLDVMPCLSQFKEKWRKVHPDYIEYFIRTWEARVDQWCLASRPAEAPTGDNIHEAYHRRLKHHVFRGRLKLDLIAILDLLHKEAEHWKNIVLSEGLLQRLSHEVNQRANTRSEPLREPRVHVPTLSDGTCVMIEADSDNEEPAAVDFTFVSRVPLPDAEPPAAAEVAAPVSALLRLGGLSWCRWCEMPAEEVLAPVHKETLFAVLRTHVW